MPADHRPPDGDPWPEEASGDDTASPAFERPWMADFVTEALRTADVPAALKRWKVGWGDYTRYRRTCPAFAVACVELDLVVKQALWTRLECSAAAGDRGAIKLLNGGLESIRAQLDHHGAGDQLARLDPRDSVPLVRLGSFALPVGPCAACARGLLVLDRHPATGQTQWAIVRHHFLDPDAAGRHHAEEWAEITPYPGAEPTDPRGLRVVYSVPREGTDDADEVEPPIHIREHQNDYGIHPKHVLPLQTGPDRAEILRRIEAVRAALPTQPTVVEPTEDAASYLPIDFAKGEQPPADTAHLYEQVSALDGSGLVWKMRPQHRHQKHQRGFDSGGGQGPTGPDPTEIRRRVAAVNRRGAGSGGRDGR